MGLLTPMGLGEGPAIEFCCYVTTENSVDEGRAGLLDDPLVARGRGPAPRGPATAVSWTAVVRAERDEPRGTHAPEGPAR